MFTLYTGAGCDNCTKAIALLTMHSQPFMTLPGRDHMHLFDEHNHKSFPLITQYGEYVGGWPELQQWIKDNT
jgi:glutaredoxin